MNPQRRGLEREANKAICLIKITGHIITSQGVIECGHNRVNFNSVFVHCELSAPVYSKLFPETLKEKPIDRINYRPEDVKSDSAKPRCH